MKLFQKLFKYPADTYVDGSLTFLSRVPVEVWVLLLAGLVVTVWLLYRSVSSKLTNRSRKILLGLRVAVFALLIFLLAKPALRLRTPRAGSIFTAVLIDTSRSMSIEDIGDVETKTRLDAARKVLLGQDGRGKSGILAEMGEMSKVLTYGFDSNARRVTDVTQLKPTGVYTNLFRSIRDMESELQAAPLAAVVLITDGCRNTGGTPEEAAKILQARNVPLHVVGIGDLVPPKDYEVVKVLVPRRVRRNTEVEVHVTVRHTDFHFPFKINIRRGDTVLLTKDVKPVPGMDLKKVKLILTPDQGGSATYTVEIPPSKEESVTNNNSQDFVLDIQDDRLPVLYIEGSPRNEYRFLRRALFRDPDFRVVGILRLASKRFYVQGANSSELYLKEGFPNTPERLFAFQAVILGDIEAGYFSKRQLGLLEDFARTRGGGVLMLGGVNSFGLGKYDNTPVGAMLPVKISATDAPYSDETFKVVATKDGLRHPVMQLLPDPYKNSRYWKSAPPLIGITPLRGIKPGALLLVAQADTGRPVLAIQNYGEGRVGAFTSGGSWYWQVSKPASDEFHEKFWKQLIRWLVVGAKEQLTVKMDSDIYPLHEPVYVCATVLKKDLKPDNNASVMASITDPLGNTEEIPMDWILSQEGVYQCRYVPSEEGDYSVSVKVQDWDDVKPEETEFRVSQPFVEFVNAGLKEETLKQMASITGGRYFAYEDAGDLPEEVANAVANAKIAGSEAHNKELWDMPLIFFLILIITGIEWFLRRYSGLA